MLNLTAKFCCRRLPPRSSMFTTETFGRLNLDVKSEQAARQSVQATVTNVLHPNPLMHPDCIRSINGHRPWHNAPTRRPATARANMRSITFFRLTMMRVRPRWAAKAGLALVWLSTAGLGVAAPPPSVPLETPSAPSTGCLESGDGYLRANLGGAIDATIDWPNSGTRCQGEPKDKPPGVRLSFQRVAGGSPDLLFVFGITGVREGRPARAAGVNL